MSKPDLFEIRQVLKSPPSFGQLAILCIDVSPSMMRNSPSGEVKYLLVAQAYRDFVERMRRSREVSNFHLAIVTFDSSAQVIQNPIPFAQATGDELVFPFEDEEYAGGGTDISESLSAARRIAGEWISGEVGGLVRSCVIVLLTDGRDREDASGGFDASNSIRLAGELRRDERLPRTSIYACFFDSADINAQQRMEAETTLRTIATDSNFRRVSDAGTIRAFFEESSVA